MSTDLPFQNRNSSSEERTSSSQGFYVNSIKRQLSRKLFYGQLCAIFISLAILFSMNFYISSNIYNVVESSVVEERRNSLLRSGIAKGMLMENQLQMVVNELEIMAELSYLISINKIKQTQPIN
jgi:hypothetical protein